MRIAALASVGIAVTAQPTAAALPACELLTVPVTVSAVQQMNFSAPFDYSTYNGTYASLPDLTVSGSYNISASLCGPTTANASRSSTLQILAHGGMYNKTYWSGLQVPPQSINGTTYSWVRYAAAQGYYTLAMDRLCNGNSSRPDAANVCQIQVQAAVMHQLAQRARNGTLGAVSRKAFSTVIYVGHSLGSESGSYYLNKYTGDVNATILTGFSSSGDTGGLQFSVGTRPARDTLARYSALQPTYIMASDSKTLRTAFYQGSYNPDVAALDYEGAGTVAYGEFLSFGLGVAVQPNVKIPVFVMNGQQDSVFCPVTPLGLLYGEPGQCGTGATSLSARTKVFFPNAASFGYYNVPNTGHCVNLHYSALMAFQAAHRFLDAQGF